LLVMSPATLYRGAALADGSGPKLELDMSLLVRDRTIEWIGPSDAEPPLEGDVEVIDASGTTAIPGLVDSHSHLTLPGGAHWIERGADPPARLIQVAEHNAQLMRSAGIRWARDVGSPQGVDPIDGRRRALSLGVRDRWRNDHNYPYVRAAGTWISRAGSLPGGLAVEVQDGDGLKEAVAKQLEDGADLVKLYLDGPDQSVAPFSAGEVAASVALAHSRQAKVTAHSTTLVGARVGVAAGVDSLEHASQLDADLARAMASKGVAMVSTLAVFASWQTFGTTTRLPRFAEPAGRAAIAARLEWARESVRLAHAAGVLIAAGSDFGGGSLRANQLAWEVEMLVGAGLEPWEALAAATRNGGLLLGEPDAGKLGVGGPADVVFVHGDPLSDPSALWRVWLVL